MSAAKASHCRLYLVTPGGLASEPAASAFAAELAAALQAGNVAAVLLKTEGLDDHGAERAAAALGAVAQDHDVAFLVEGRVHVARAANADGVHLSAAEALVSETRALVGPEAIVGVACGNSRHAAMAAGEAGADYVAFEAPQDELAELLAVWHESMTLPCVAMGISGGEIGLENGAALARAGADFVAVGEAVWNHPEGPAAAVAAFLERLSEGPG